MRIAATAALLGALYAPASAQGIEMLYEVRAQKPDAEWIQLIRNDAEKVPDRIQDALNRAGGRIVIFDGDITDNPELKEYKGMKLPNTGLSYGIIDGKYLQKKAFVRQRIERYTGSISPVLHEIGHMVDEVFDYPSESESFRNAMKPVKGFYEGVKEPWQVWAEGFARYYYSPGSNADMKKKFPGLHSYFADFELRAYVRVFP